ncbi:MAG: 3'-5' exonuclease [Clostridia bacterium]|nr:3'-5' exonuclease [Clostridia bacterium]
MQRYIAFDVETPNSRNDRMSAIGLAVIEDGRIKRTFSSLINPETYFNSFNVALTGITPEMAEAAPTFDMVWDVIGPAMESGILIAHNAPFDMSVLAKCLRAYCIDAPVTMDYACTVQMGRKLYPGLPDHRLDTMCRFLDIPLDHHRADSDALACAKLFIDYGQKGLDAAGFIRTFDLSRCCTLRPGRKH